MGPTRGSTVSKASLMGEVCNLPIWGAAGESVQVQGRPAAPKSNSTCSFGGDPIQKIVSTIGQFYPLRDYTPIACSNTG